MTEKERFSAYMLEKYNSNVEWFGGKPIKALDLLLWDAWQAATQRDGFKFVPINPTSKMIVAIENKVEQQLEASAINQDPFRLDGERIFEAMMEVVGD